MSAPPTGTGAPSSRQLIRSTIIAAVVAGVLLVTCVLPAEYGVDPTGVGRVLGLTAMGEVKVAMAEEAAANAAALASADSVVAAAEAAPEAASADVADTSESAANVVAERSDTTLLTLEAGKGGEVKLQMAADARATFRWEITGGVVNYDMHGDSTNAPKDWFVSYRKGQGAAGDSGEMIAGFSGNHGWYWRNRGRAPVVVRLFTTGRYSAVSIHP